MTLRTGKVRKLNDLSNIVDTLKQNGKSIVFVHGFFDILHRGHIQLLKESKKLGDILIVGIDHDYNAKKIKGPERPINSHSNRIAVIQSIEYVDYCFLIPSFKNIKNLEGFYIDIYKKIKPHILATCVNAGKHGQLKRDQCRKVGIKFVNIRHKHSTISTTKLIESLKNSF